MLISFVFFFIAHVTGEEIKLLKTVKIERGEKRSGIADLILGKKERKLFYPAAVFYAGEARTGIVDQVNALVLILNEYGIVKKQIPGFGKTRFGSPVSGCAGGGGNFYISDSALKVIVKYNDPDKFDKVVLADEEMRVTGICYYGEKLFCTDTANHRVIILDDNGVLKGSFGRRGTGMGEFNFPTHICADSGYIYVTDALNSRIQIFDHNGVFIRTFGKNGMRGGDFSKPKGIAVDSKKRIFVSDVMFDNVQVFSFDGVFLSYFGGSGSGDDHFWMPNGLMIDRNELIYVADTYNNRIKIYKVFPEKE